MNAEDEGQFGHLRWLLDIEIPLLVEDASWRKKQEQVKALPRWFYEPEPEVRAFFDWLVGLGTVPVLTPELWAKVKRHIQHDFIAYLHHFCFYDDRDTRVTKLAQPTASQLTVAWRFMCLIAAGVPVRMDALKTRQAGISWLLCQIVAWVVMFRENMGSVQAAHDAPTSKVVFKYIKDAHEKLPNELRPLHEYSSRTELTLRNPDPEQRRAGNGGLNSSAVVRTAGTDFLASGHPVQVLHCSEIGKWHKVCDVETVYTSVVNAVQAMPGTIIIRESTAHGAETFWHKEWKSSLKMGGAGWNGFTPVFIPWYYDERNSIKSPPGFELDSTDDAEFGDEKTLKKLYDLSDDQLWWRRETIKKQVDVGRSKTDLFKQEHPSNQVEAWLHAFGKWMAHGEFENMRIRLQEQKRAGFLREVFKGDIDPKRSVGVDGPTWPVRPTDDFLRHRSTGPLTIYRMPDFRHDYILGVDVAEGLSTGDHSCVELYQRVGFEAEGKRPMRLAAEWYGLADVDLFAEILWRLGWMYGTGKGSKRIPALIAWEKTGSGRGIATWLRKGGNGTDMYPPSRMYRRHKPETGGQQRDTDYGINTSWQSKPVMLDTWIKAVRDDELQVNDRILLEAAELERTETGRVDTQGRDAFMGSVLAAYGASFTGIMWGKEDEEKKQAMPHSVAWAVEHGRKQSGHGSLEKILNLGDEI